MNWEDHSWINIENSQWFKRAAYLLRRHTAKMKYKWVKGHSRELGNEMSDQLVKQSQQKHT